MPDLSIGFDSSRAPAQMAQWVKAAESGKRAASDFEKGVGRASESVKKAGRAQESAAQKAERYTRTQALIAKIMRETGASHVTAARAVRLFGKDIDRAERDVVQYARAMDRAEREVKQLTVAQRTGGGIAGAFAGSLKNIALQALAAYAGLDIMRRVVRFIAGEVADAVREFADLQEAVVGLRKVTDQLDEASLSGLVSQLEHLASTTVPVATTELIDLAATAGQIGIQTAEGLRIAAETGAQLARATDLSGESAIKSLARILAIQGEGITSLDNLGSALVALGNTSRATEAEIEPVANEIARATANFKLGSPTILGYSAALAEMGAKAEGSGTALAKLFNALLDAATTGDKLEELAHVAGMTADQLKELTRRDVSEAAISFLEGLGRFGEQGKVALDKVGLSSERTAKALLPLAANAERLRDRIELANKEFESNQALSKEAGEAFKTLRADAQRAQNAYKLLTTDGIGLIAPALSVMLRSLAASLVAWRHIIKEIRGVPIVAVAASVSVALLSQKLEKLVKQLLLLPGRLSIFGKLELDKILQPLALLGRLPGGAGLPFARAAQDIRKLQVELLKLGFAGFKSREGLDEGATGADDLRKMLAGLMDEIDGLLGGFENLETKSRNVRQELLDQITAMQTLLATVRETGEPIDDVQQALQLMAEGFEGSAAQALALVQQLKALERQAEVTRTAQSALNRTLPERPSILDPQPVEVDVSRGARERRRFEEIDPFKERLRDAFADNTDFFREQLINVAAAFGTALIDESVSFSSFLEANLSQIGSAAGSVIGEAMAPGIGGQIGGALGGLAGTLLSGLFGSGADEASAKLKVVNGQLAGMADIIQGDLGPALALATDNLRQMINSIVAEFGLVLNEGAQFGFKIRPDENIFRAYFRGMVKEFESEAELIGFLTAEIIATSTISALGPSVMEALRGGDFANAEELVASLRWAENLDNLLRGPTEQAFAAMSREVRIFMSTAADLGVDLSRAAQGAQVMAQAMVDQHKNTVLAAAGLSGQIEAWKSLRESIAIVSEQGIAELERQLKSATDAALAQAQAAIATEEGFAAQQAAFEGWLRDTGLGVDMVQDLSDRFADLAEQGLTAEEIVDELVVSLEGLDSAQIRQAIQRFRADFLAGTFEQLAGLARQAGQNKLANELAAKAEELRFTAQIIGIQITLKAAVAEGIINQERAKQINESIRTIQAAWNELRRSGLTGGRGGGAGRRPTAPTAAEQADELRQIQEAWMSLTRSLQETDLAGSVRESVDRAQQAMADAMAAAAGDQALYAPVGAAIRAGLEAELGQIGRDALGALGSEFVRISRARQAAVADIRYLMDHLEQLGLTARQVGQVVAQAVVPQILQMAIAAAEGAGDLEAAAEYRRQQAQIERALQILQLEAWRAMLQAAGALSDTLNALIDDTIVRLTAAEILVTTITSTAMAGRPDLTGLVKGPKTTPGAPRFADVRLGTGSQFRPGAGGTAEEQAAAAAAGQSLADIIGGLIFDLASPAEQAAIRFERLRESILAATGSEEERAQALILAQQQYDRERLAGLQSLQDEILGAQAARAPGGLAAAAGRFQQVVAGGDLAAIEAAAEQLRQIAQGAGGASQRAIDRIILDAIGPLLGTTGATPGVLPVAPPTTGAISAPVPSPVVISTPSPALALPPALERRLEAIEGHLASIVQTTGTAAANTGQTARGFSLLEPILRRGPGFVV